VEAAPQGQASAGRAARQGRNGGGALAARGAWPTFLILGAAKSGTTALYAWLRQHPDVYMSPVKQPHYFAGLTPTFSGPGDQALNREIVTSEAEYLRLFAPGATRRARGEASPFYLYYAERTMERLRRTLPEARLVVLLREPVSRAYSGYLHLVRDGRETLSFQQALDREEERRARGWEPLWAHRALGLYAQQLAIVLEAFPRQQVGVWLYDDMRTRPAALFEEVCRFIGVDPGFRPTLSRHNQSGVPRSAALHALLVKLRAPHVAKALLPEPVAQWVVARYLQRRPPPADVASALGASYREELQRLAALLPEKDFAAWGVAAA
jgi:hypothetical protein